MKSFALDNYRWSSRFPIDLAVTVFPSQGTPLNGRIQDISFGGLRIMTDNSPPENDTPVTLGLVINDGQQEKFYSMNAKVVRQTSEGMGLMFDDYDNKTIACLRRLYRDALN